MGAFGKYLFPDKETPTPLQPSNRGNATYMGPGETRQPIIALPPQPVRGVGVSPPGMGAYDGSSFQGGGYQTANQQPLTLSPEILDLLRRLFGYLPR